MGEGVAWSWAPSLCMQGLTLASQAARLGSAASRSSSCRPCRSRSSSSHSSTPRLGILGRHAGGEAGVGAPAGQMSRIVSCRDTHVGVLAQAPPGGTRTVPKAVVAPDASHSAGSVREVPEATGPATWASPQVQQAPPTCALGTPTGAPPTGTAGTPHQPLPVDELAPPPVHHGLQTCILTLQSLEQLQRETSHRPGKPKLPSLQAPPPHSVSTEESPCRGCRHLTASSGPRATSRGGQSQGQAQKAPRAITGKRRPR